MSLAGAESRPTAEWTNAGDIHYGRSSLTVNLYRPFARRAARTLRPFLVAIRARNPCVERRRRRLG
jgi:hypothetical protein